MMLEPLGEVGANFSLQLSSRTQFTKINNKKVIAENQCEKHKKSSLVKSNRQHTSLDETIKLSQPEFYANTSLSSQVLCRKHNIYMYLGEYST